jgi:hypothetical protein
MILPSYQTGETFLVRKAFFSTEISSLSGAFSTELKRLLKRV